MPRYFFINTEKAEYYDNHRERVSVGNGDDEAEQVRTESLEQTSQQFFHTSSRLIIKSTCQKQSIKSKKYEVATLL